ncbi:MAG: glycerophosphodiester phosphodiesterase [Rubrivivax sp.]|nr:glycerophosphodiester phosphodiesterase [Rubrivivax sp.]
MGDWPYPFWIAHRGAGKLAPENTLAAFRLGAAHGYRAFECDVKLSADERAFLLHDSSLQRTTNGEGQAGRLDWEALSRLDAGSWHSRAFAGEPLPTLAAIAAYVQANGYALNIEIKPSPGTEHRTGQVVGQCVRDLWQGSSPWPLFSSFRPEALQGARETAPEVPRALLLDSLWEGWFAVAQALGCRAIVTNYGLMNQTLLAQAHEAGLKALVYTVNDPSPAAWLQALGIDGIITDAVDRFAPAR